jgi:hypothetical protein
LRALFMSWDYYVVIATVCSCCECCCWLLIIDYWLLICSELDNPKVLNQSRMIRIARGSGKSLREVNELITQYKAFEKVIFLFYHLILTFCVSCLDSQLNTFALSISTLKMVGKMKGMKPGRTNINQLQSMINPQILKYVHPFVICISI